MALATIPGGEIMTEAAEEYFKAGQWDDALAVLQSGRRGRRGRRGRHSGDPIPVHGLIALIAGHRNDSAMAQEHLAAVRDQANGPRWLPEGSCYLLLARAVAAERGGQPAEAMALLAQCLDRRLTRDLTHRHLLFPVLTRLALAAGDTATASASVQAALEETPSEQLPAQMTAAQMTAAAHCRGLIEGGTGPLLAAAAYYRSAGCLVDRAQVLEDAAVLLARQGQMVAAQRAFDIAAGLYNGFGASWDLCRADARLSFYGIRPSEAARQVRCQRPSCGGSGALSVR
jgi:tetratricopeptide (TPR) repeat protein